MDDIVTDSYKELLKRWPGESTEGLIGRYRLKLVSTFIIDGRWWK